MTINAAPTTHHEHRNYADQLRLESIKACEVLSRLLSLYDGTLPTVPAGLPAEFRPAGVALCDRLASKATHTLVFAIHNLNRLNRFMAHVQQVPLYQNPYNLALHGVRYHLQGMIYEHDGRAVLSFGRHHRRMVWMADKFSLPLDIDKLAKLSTRRREIGPHRSMPLSAVSTQSRVAADSVPQVA